MSITDELRGWAKNQDGGTSMTKWQIDMLLAIADRIDAAYQKAEDEWKAKDGQSWLNGYAECRAELMEGNEAISASLEEAGWVRLPKDADGVPLATRVAHINHPQVPLCVLAMTYSVEDRYWKVLTQEEDGLRRYESYSAYELRAYTPLTVEGVLRELLDACQGQNADFKALLVVDAAKRLQLRGDAE